MKERKQEEEEEKKKKKNGEREEEEKEKVPYPSSANISAVSTILRCFEYAQWQRKNLRTV